MTTTPQKCLSRKFVALLALAALLAPSAFAANGTADYFDVNGTASGFGTPNSSALYDQNCSTNDTTTLTTGFASSATVTSVAVTSATGIAVNQTFAGAGVPLGVLVTSVSGTTIGVSSFTSTAGNSGNYNFGYPLAWTTDPNGVSPAPTYFTSGDQLTFGTTANPVTGTFTVNLDNGSHLDGICVTNSGAYVTLIGTANTFLNSSGEFYIAAGSALTIGVTHDGGLNFNGEATTITGGGTNTWITDLAGNSSSTTVITQGSESGGATGTSLSPTVNFNQTAYEVGGSYVLAGSYYLLSGTLNFGTAVACANDFGFFANGSIFQIGWGSPGPNPTIDNTSGSAQTLSLGSATYSLAGDFTFLGSSSLSLGNAAVSLTGTPRQITVNNNTLTIGGGIVGSGDGITKLGSGTLALTGANSFTGGLIVNGGTVTASAANVGSSSQTVTPVAASAPLATALTFPTDATTTISPAFAIGAVTSVTVASTTGIAVGQTLAGTGVPGGAIVTAVNTGTKVVTVSFTASAASTGNYTFSGAVVTSLTMGTAFGSAAAGLAVTGTGIPAGVTVSSVSGTTVNVSSFTTTAASSGNYVFGTSADANQITVTSATGLEVGQTVTGTGIAAGAEIENISGPTLTLSQNNTAVGAVTGTFGAGNSMGSGNVTISSGTLSFSSGSFPTSSSFQINLNSGGMLNAASSSTTLTLGSGQVMALNGGVFGANISALSDSSATIDVAASTTLPATTTLSGGTLVFSANGSGTPYQLTTTTLDYGSAINFTVSSLPAGFTSYPQTVALINYTSIGSGTLAVGTVSLPAGFAGTVIDGGSGVVYLNLTGGPSLPLTWNGNASGTPNGSWDFSTLNWVTTGSANTGAGTSAYADGLAVTFDDSAPGTPTVSVAAEVQPTSVTVSNSVLAYTFSGSGYIGGVANLVKKGNNTAALDTTNSYTGGTTISAGTLTIGGSGDLGDPTRSGSGSYSGAVANSGIFNYNSTAAQTLSGVISGSGVFEQNGSGTLTLSATNTYNGTTSIGAGTLKIGGAGQLGSGAYAGNITNTGAFNYNSSAAQTLSGVISGTGGTVTQNGPGMLTLSGANTYTGGSTANAGTLQAGNTTAFGAANKGTITVASGATLDDNGQNLIAYTNIVSGSGVNNFGAIVNNGAAQTMAFGYITLAGNTTFGGTNRWDMRPTTSGFLLTGGQPYNLTKVGTNQITLVHPIYVDPALSNIVVQAGDLGIQEGGVEGLGTNGAVTVFSNATLEVDFGDTLTNLTKPVVLLDGAALNCSSSANSIADPVTLSTNYLGGPGNCTFNITGSFMTLSNVVSGPGNLINIGSGSAGLTLAAVCTYTGNTTNSAGATLQEGIANAIPGGTGAGDVTVNGTNDLNTYNETINGLNGSGIVNTVAGGSPTLTVGANGDSGTFSGVIKNAAGSLALVKTGGGTQTLSGASTYSGNTTINGGTLTLGTGGSIAGSPVITIYTNTTLNAAAAGITLTGSSPQQTLAASGTNGTATISATSKTVTLAASALLSFQMAGGSSPTVGKISVTGTSANLTLNANVVTVNVAGSALAAGTYRLMDCTGTLTGSANTTPTITGTALSSGYTATVSTTAGSAGHVDLIVKATPVFSGLSSPAITYGTSSLTLNGTVSSVSGVTTVYPANGDAVSATINGHTVNGTVSGSLGAFSITYNDTSLATDGVGGAPYTITYAYAGNSAQFLNAANDTSTAMAVNSLVVALAGSRAYDGTTNAAYSILSVANMVGSDNVTVASGVGGLAGANAGTWAITTLGTLTLGGTAAGNYTLAGAGGSVIITQAVTSVTLASSENPSGFQDSLAFTASLPALATGNVIFLTNSVVFDTEPLSGGLATSVATTLLPRGNDTITAEYAGDGNYLGSTNNLAGGQIVTNHPPVASTMTVYRTAGLSLIIPLADVATNWSDPDGDTVTLAGINLVTTNGVNLSTNSSYIFYLNSSNVADQISYTVADGYGGNATGLINILVNPFVAGQSATVSVGGSTATVSFAGIPGYTYSVLRSTNLVDWVTIVTTNAPAGGLFSYTDNFSDLGVVPSSAYYQLEWNP